MKLSWHVTILTLGGKYRSGGIFIALKSFKEQETLLIIALKYFVDLQLTERQTKVEQNGAESRSGHEVRGYLVEV